MSLLPLFLDSSCSHHFSLSALVITDSKCRQVLFKGPCALILLLHYYNCALVVPYIKIPGIIMEKNNIRKLQYEGLKVNVDLALYPQ